MTRNLLKLISNFVGDSTKYLPVIVSAFVAAYGVLIPLEIALGRKGRVRVSSVREALASLATGGIHLALTMAIPLSAQLFFLRIAYAHAPRHLPSGVAQFVFAFLLTDLVYYLQHRLNHVSDFFWSFHQAHHTSRELNLFTGIRVSWITPIFAAVFFAPISWLGVRPDYVIVSLALVFYGQWWCHTQLLGKLGWLEAVFNTPSSHRVHHSVRREDSDHNYAGVLIIWDRLLGTYQGEATRITRFGTSDGFVGYNPVTINLGGFWRYLNQKRVLGGG